MGEWMTNAHHDHDAQDEVATAVLQQLLGVSQGLGVQRDPETSNYFLPAAWTEHVYNQHIAHYDDHVFWDELAERLAQRDLARRRGVKPDQINRDDDAAELRPLEERYRHELHRHGIDRLDLSDDF